MAQRKFDLDERLLHFAVAITSVVESLPDSKICNHLGGQLLRSGTLPSLNYGEAQAVESKRDFIHKLGIILEELRETINCLKILDRKSLLSDKTMIEKNNELIAIFVKSIETARRNS